MYSILKKWFGLKYEKSKINTGCRSVGFFMGICFIINAVTGSGIPFISIIFQNAGLLMTILLLIIYSFTAVQSSIFIVDAMKAVPGNEKFDAAIEFTTLVDFFFGRGAYILCLVFFLLALMSSTVESIVITSQTIDSLYVNLFGATCGLGISPLMFHCVSTLSEQYPSPFEDRYMLFTLGFITVILLVIPFGLYSLEQNMAAQIAFFIAVVAIILIWFGLSIAEGPDFSKVPLIGSSYLYAPGTIMLNLSVASIIPSWLNLKKLSVDTRSSIVVSVATSAFLYFLGGYFPATVLDIGDSGNFNPAMVNLSLLGKFSIYLFPLAALIPSIPINMMVSASNLKRDGIKTRAIVLFLSFVLPWIVCIPLQTGTVMIKFVSWTSVIFSSTVNFVISPILYLKSRNFKRKFTETGVQKIVVENEGNIELLLNEVCPIDRVSENKNHLIDSLNNQRLETLPGVTSSPTLQLSDCCSSGTTPEKSVLQVKSADNTPTSKPESRDEIIFDKKIPSYDYKPHGSIENEVIGKTKEDSRGDNRDSTVLALISTSGSPNSDPQVRERAKGANYNHKLINILYELTASKTSIAYINIVIVIFSILMNLGVEIHQAIK